MTESWSQLGAAVRTAQAIGLHRDGADMVSVAPRMFQLVLIEFTGYGVCASRAPASYMVSGLLRGVPQR